jgi:hypothetical protein
MTTTPRCTDARPTSPEADRSSPSSAPGGSQSGAGTPPDLRGVVDAAPSGGVGARCNQVESKASAAIEPGSRMNARSRFVVEMALFAKKSSLFSAKKLPVKGEKPPCSFRSRDAVNPGSAPDRAGLRRWLSALLFAFGGGGARASIPGFQRLAGRHKILACFFFSRKKTRARVHSWRDWSRFGIDGGEKSRAFWFSDSSGRYAIKAAR